MDDCVSHCTAAHTLIGSSGIGELIANTLAVRNVTVVVQDVKPIATENCEPAQ